MSNRLKTILAVVAILVVSVTVLLFTAPDASAQTELPKPVLHAEFKNNAIELNWASINEAARYELWTWTAEDEWILLSGDDLTDTSFLHTDLVAGRTYFYWVRALNSSGDPISAWSVRNNASVPASYPVATATPTTAPADSITEPTVTPTSTVAPDHTVTPTPTPTSTAEPAVQPTATPTATPTPTLEPGVQPTVTPMPVEGDDDCVIIVHLDSFTMRLHPRSLTGFINWFGEAPVAREVHTAWFIPTTGIFEVGYRITLSDGRYVMIWEFWKGCQYNGGVTFLSDYNGHRLDE